MTRPRQKILIFSIFLISTVIILLNRLTALYINSTAIHFIFFFLSLGSFAIMVVEYLLEMKTVRSILITLLVVAVGSFAKAFFTWGGDWKTQTVIYRNHYHPSQTIEFQMRGDRFAFGYKKQVIERHRIIPYFDIIKHVDTAKVNKTIWDRVDERVNEMGLPGDYTDLPVKNKSE